MKRARKRYGEEVEHPVLAAGSAGGDF